MMSHGYNPAWSWSEGAIKPPIFQTSTFVFKNAEEGKAFFELAYGLRQQGPDEEMGLIYSRLNNPSLEILENRLCLWDEAEEAASFASGMAAISTTLLGPAPARRCGAALRARVRRAHLLVQRTYYLTHLAHCPAQQDIYHCISPGSMISFDIRGGEPEAFCLYPQPQASRIYTRREVDCEKSGARCRDATLRVSASPRLSH